MKVAVIVAILFLGVPESIAADWPLFLRENATNSVKLPEGASEIFVATSLKHAFIPLRDANKEASFFVPSFDAPQVAACRVKVKGRWQQIRQSVVENEGEFTRSLNWTGNLSEPVQKIHLGVLPKANFRCEVVANRIGSSLDPILQVFNSKGKQVAECDDGVYSARDSMIEFEALGSVDYTLELRDVSFGTGSDFYYYVRGESDWSASDAVNELHWVSPPPYLPGLVRGFASSRAEDASSVEVPYTVHAIFNRARDQDWFEFKTMPKQRLIIQADTRAFGSPCDAGLSLFDHDGNLISQSVGTGPDGPSITNRFETPGKYRVQVREITGGGEGWPYRLTIKEAQQGVVLTTEAERVDFSKEGEAKIKVACKRYDYDGPVKLDVDRLPEGVLLADSVIEKGKNEGELKLKREKEVEGFQVRLTGLIEDKGTKEGFPVSTMPALRKLYPLQMFPCAAMDGWIAVNPAP